MYNGITGPSANIVPQISTESEQSPQLTPDEPHIEDEMIASSSDSMVILIGSNNSYCF